MGTHKFRVGQLVDFKPRQGGAASGPKYKILRLLPHQNGEPLYRIKTIAEPLIRVATEAELTMEPNAHGHGRVLQFPDPGTRQDTPSAPA